MGKEREQEVAQGTLRIRVGKKNVGIKDSSSSFSHLWYGWELMKRIYLFNLGRNTPHVLYIFCGQECYLNLLNW